MRRASSIAMLLAVVLFAGCRDDVADPGTPQVLTLIRIIPLAAWLHPGDTLRLEALPFDEGGERLSRMVPFAWRSAAPAIATVDSTGLVTGVGLGDAEVGAGAEGLEATSLIHVIPEPPASTGFRSIVAGDEFTCGVEPTGVVLCWGRNSHGELGNGGVWQGKVPTAVSGLTGVEVLAAGTRHACAVDAEGLPWCWGWNSVRQVGCWFEDKIASVPVAVPVAGRFEGIAAGSGHTCALREDDAVFCWGANPLGQLGGDTLGTGGIVRVAGVPRLIAVAAGHAHTCGLDADGRAWCWGWNARGQLGASTSEACLDGNPCSTIPILVATPVRFRSLAAGDEFTCGLDVAGAAYCWGMNALGQLGSGRGGTSVEPVRVNGVPPLIELRAGREHACGLTAQGVLWCWGDNRHGQLGDGTGVDPPGPVVATLAPSPTVRFALGGAHSCAVGVSGDAICWGGNAFGQLGLHPAS
jgi:alpha-tubulin suppressor-like RCC1 family protein